MKEKITQYLIEKYEAKGVILYGSLPRSIVE